MEIEIMETLLGPGVTKEWTSWIAKADLPTIDEILRGKWKLDPARPDRTYMIVTQLCEHMKAFEKSDRATAIKQAIPAWNQVHRLLKDGVGDLTVEPGKILALANLGPDCDNADVAQLSAEVIHDMTSAGFTPFA
jgi:hypothetical protein